MPHSRVSIQTPSSCKDWVLRAAMGKLQPALWIARARHPRAALCALALLPACTASTVAPPPVHPAPQAAVAVQARGDLASRCRAFAGEFAALVACQRADGTLQTFSDARIAWRVRYFFRYWEMPCQEAPTRNESYVFDLATKDLYRDRDLSDSQRVALRNAMFEGRERCR